MKEKLNIIGSGLFGSVCAYFLKNKYDITVLDERNHIGGNCYTENIYGIDIHKYGPHIFHTNNKEVWDFVNSIVEFQSFKYNCVVNYNDVLYSFPFNMWTYNKLWNVKTYEQALNKIKETSIINDEDNLENYIISKIGKELYTIFIEGYTTKQWGIHPSKLSKDIIKRIPIRNTFNTSYFNNDNYCGIPTKGYTNLIEILLQGVDVKLNTQYNKIDNTLTIYTGSIDRLLDYKYGKLPYRCLMFEEKIIDKEDYQSNPVINYTSIDIPYTRIIEHKHFMSDININKTIISKEFPAETGVIAYPINNDINNALYNKYKNDLPKNIILGGRLGDYKYYDMDKTIESAFNLIKNII